MNERKKLYRALEERIGGTKLELYKGKVSNGNQIYIKRECDNPFGSHYDRVYLALFRELEEKEELKPGINVLETSSGSAGVSFAGIGRELGYRCYVMIPGGEQLMKRREAIAAQGAEVIITPEDEYINGFPKRMPKYISELGARFLNHSMGRKGANNETTLRALEFIAGEALNEISVDFYVVGIGNGSSIVGPGRVLKSHNSNLQIVGYKPRKSGKTDLPGLLNQDGLDLSMIIHFPHIVEAEKLMNEIVIVDDWGKGVYNHGDLGRTTKAGISVALDIAKK